MNRGSDHRSGAGSSRTSAASRESSDGCKIYCCTVCTRLEVASYEFWLWHLGSREHQLSLNKSRASSNWRRNEYRVRCITVHGIRGLKAREVLEYLGYWGEIEDFSYSFINKGEDGAVNHCLCLYRDVESAEACVKQRHHEFKEKMLSISLKRRFPLPRDPREVEENRKRRFSNDYSGFGRGRKERRVDED